MTQFISECVAAEMFYGHLHGLLLYKSNTSAGGEQKGQMKCKIKQIFFFHRLNFLYLMLLFTWGRGKVLFC